MSVVLYFAAAFVESAANPSGNLGRGVFVPFLTLVFGSPSLCRIGSGWPGSDPAGEIRGPLDRQVLVGEKRFPFFPISSI